MHQTTIRFSHELWDTLELAAEDGGVSVAQYVREAAIERLARSGALGRTNEVTPARLAEGATSLEFTRDASRAVEA